jgi:ABC-type transport system involved in multi-copper enzyme maturation permease subunit
MSTLQLLRAFFAAELFKLRRSRLAKAALAAMCVAPVVSIGIVWALGSDASYYPNVLPVIGTGFWLLSGLTALLLTAGTVGSEFEMGTGYAAVGRGTPRWLFVMGKAIVLLGAAAANTLAGWLCGGLVATVSHLIQVGTDGLGGGLRLMLTSGLVGVGVAVLSAASYVGLVLVVAILTRSSAFSMFGGLGLFMVDFVMGEFSPAGEMGEKGLGAFSVMSNTNLLLNRTTFSMGADWSATTGAEVGASTAALVLICYAIGGVALACVLFQRQDLRGRP